MVEQLTSIESIYSFKATTDIHFSSYEQLKS